LTIWILGSTVGVQSGVRVAKNTIWLVVMPGVVFAQESTSGQGAFDPRFDGPTPFGWDGYVLGTAFVLVLLGFWWWFSSFIQRHRTTIPWVTLRYAWPAFAVAVGLLIQLAADHLPPIVLAPLIAIYIVLDPPALVGAILTNAALNLEPRSWLAISVMCSTGAALTYLTVRFLEWRAWINVPVYLNLRDRPGDST